MGRLEQLADVGQSDPALSGRNHATTGSGPTRQSDARDPEPLLVSVDEARAGQQIKLTIIACWEYHHHHHHDRLLKLSKKQVSVSGLGTNRWNRQTGVSFGDKYEYNYIHNYGATSDGRSF